MMKVAASLTLLAGSYATDCSPGYTHKKVLTNLKCKSSAGTATLNGKDNCNTNCCDLDKKTCGGNAPVACAATKYMTKDGKGVSQTVIDSWMGTATTAANAPTDCCINKAKCGSASYSCPTGMVKDSTKTASDCTTNDASCGIAPSPCCKAATDGFCKVAKLANNKLLSDNTACAAGSISGKSLCAAGDTTCIDAWEAVKFATTPAATDATKQAACCVATPSCFSMKGAVSCVAGKTFGPTTGAGAISASNPKPLTTDFTSAGFKAQCCVADSDSCAGATVTCASGSYKSAALDARSVKGATAAQKNKMCCAPKAKCSNYACPAGTKVKKSAVNTACSGDVATCQSAVCCDKDLTTCGGNFPGDTASITCAAGFYDERAFWVAVATPTVKATTQAAKDAWKLKNTSSSTKTKECCTPVANCTNITTKAGVTTTPAAGVATTTPAPVVTTTPAAAPALKFSEHKIALDKSSGSNMVWLGVGGVLGMGVLMVVQHVRSSRYAPVRDVSLE